MAQHKQHSETSNGYHLIQTYLTCRCATLIECLTTNFSFNSAKWSITASGNREIGQKEIEGETIQLPLHYVSQTSPCSAHLFLPNYSVWPSLSLILTGTIWLDPLAVTCMCIICRGHRLCSSSSIDRVRRRGGGGTHVHRMWAHPGYRLWYCRQHCSTLSSLFSAFRPSGDNEGREERKSDRGKHGSLYKDKENSQ